MAKYRVFEERRFGRDSKFIPQIKLHWWSRWREIQNDSFRIDLEVATRICREHKKFMLRGGAAVKHPINETS